MTIEKPREPLSVGAVVVWTIIHPLFGLIALAVRNRDLDYGEPRITKEVEPAHPINGPVFRIMLIVGVAILALLLHVGGK